MKNKNIFAPLMVIVLLMTSLSLSLHADEKGTKIEIKTSAQCGMCKASIEKAVNKLEGVHKSDLDMKTKKCTVWYDKAEVEIKDIKKAITRLGYDADDKKGNKRAYKKLPKCCQKPEL